MLWRDILLDVYLLLQRTILFMETLHLDTKVKIQLVMKQLYSILFVSYSFFIYICLLSRMNSLEIDCRQRLRSLNGSANSIEGIHMCKLIHNRNGQMDDSK